jgi:serine/threonine protein kinase
VSVEAAPNCRILSAIGAGGMGEVIAPLTPRSDATSRSKFCRRAFAHDAERLARFEREAKTLAVLNHPHIAQIYGLED